MKIAYIIQSLSFKGGTERVLTEKMNYMSEHYGYDIYVITCNQPPSETNCYYLSNKITQINLDIRNYSVYKYRYPERLWKKWAIHSIFKKKIAETINHINPDIIIGVGHYKANCICKLYRNAKIIIECHDGRLITSLLTQKTKRSIISKLYMPFYRWIYFRTIEHYADTIVTLTDGAKEKWRKAKNVVVIPNFTSMSVLRYSTCNTKRIISVGRLRWEKGFDRLIDIWKCVSYKYPSWKLDIFGEGEQKEQLTNRIHSENIPNIYIHDNTSNISYEYADSSICLITSYFEGFSLVLLEAMKHGLPCIAFDCPFGPGSIIQNGINGYLIKEGNNTDYINKLCDLIENISLRKQLSKAAIERAKFFDTDKIMEQWRFLFESIVNTNNSHKSK